MKKKLLIVFGCTIILLIVLFAASGFGFKVEKEITISAPIFDVSPAITDLRNWKLWFAELKDKDTANWSYSTITNAAGSYLRVGRDQYTIVSGNPVSITVKATRDGITSYYFITVQPDTVSTITHARWVTWLSSADWLHQKLSLSTDNPQARLKSLQNYLQDPRQFYGFTIAVEKVVDTFVLTKEAVVKKTELTASLGKMFKDLMDYASANHLTMNTDSSRMASFYSERGDSIHIAAGIPISHRGISKDGMLFLEMPVKGKMLVGQYEGTYSGLPKLYHAMQKYAFDKKLHLIGAAYEKYLSFPRSSSDSLHMKIELHFPVI